jgi:monoamine oxidase
MDRLPNAFLPELAPYLRFGARVKEVNWEDKDKVQVRYTVGSKDHVEKGDAAILAVPVPVLRQMWFVPQLSPEKRRAIRQLHYDSATKIFLQFRERFWEEEGVQGGTIVTDHPIRTAYFPSSGGCNDRGVLLASYTWGDDALIWGSLPEPARINQALRGITHLFQRKRKRVDVRRLFEGGVSKSWHEDPFAGGAFALFQPGQQQLHKHIVCHEGPIYFAGEHTTLRHAWIEGAIESGIRTAQALFQRFEGGDELDLSKDFTD